ncbi:DGQHR domain-containing protein [Mesorhizobium sp. M1148]|uniref:DGQHR domain-containing protein n=1 Tax=unclassified Mesorhizobium TaxID=325217 RepID=UPI0033399E31
MTRRLRIPVIGVRQPIGMFFIGKAEAKEVLQACAFDFRRIVDRGGYKDFLGIQRELKVNRLRKIGEYIATRDAAFPTGIVLSADSRTVEFEGDENNPTALIFSEYVDPEQPDFRIEYGDIFSIIDGQHRLKAFDYTNYQGVFELNISIFVDVDDATEAEIFSTVNLAQTKVNNSLVYDLFSLASSRSAEKTCHEIVVNLDSLQESPFFNRIKRLGSATEGRFGETLSQATVVRGMLPYITNDTLRDRDVGKRIGFWDPIDGKSERKRIFYEFFRTKQDAKILRVVLNYFEAIEQRWPEAWKSTGTGNMINRTNGYNAFIRFLRPAYRHFTSSPEIVGREQFSSLFDRVKLTDRDFNRDRFVPGSTGAKQLYDVLIHDSNVEPV